MAKIKDETLTRVKQIPFTEVLQSYDLKFKKVGREAVTLCPWHNDTNPSLTINDQENFCFCFVCHGGGDHLDFVQQKLGLSFAEAIETTCGKFNVPVEYIDVDPAVVAKEREKRRRLINQLQEEQEKYRSNIRDPALESPREYLRQRNIQPVTSKTFELGYARTGQFFGRITIPVHDHKGNLVGFSARALDDSVKPKYKNSINDELFNKSALVFNEHRALQHIREADSIIFVEGQLDVISMWQAGIRNVVAMQGTQAPDHTVLTRLKRRTNRFILCYDADYGGIKAIEQFIKVAGPMACAGELTISIVNLPHGLDPDEYIKQGKDIYELIENAPPWLDWQLECWLSQIDRSDTAKFSQIETTVKQFVNSIKSPALRQHYIDKASAALVEDSKGAAKYAKKWYSAENSFDSHKSWERPELIQTRMTAEKRMIRMYIHNPESRPTYRPLMEKIQSPAYRWLWQRIQELEQYGEGILSGESVMAILAVSEPHYTRQLRPIARPTIRLEKFQEILKHTESILFQELTTEELTSNV